MKFKVNWNNHYFRDYHYHYFILFSIYFIFCFIKACIFNEGKNKSKQISFNIVKYANIYLFLKLPEEMRDFQQSFPE